MKILTESFNVPFSRPCFTAIISYSRIMKHILPRASLINPRKKKSNLGESLAGSHAYNPIRDSRRDFLARKISRTVSPKVSSRVSPRVSDRIICITPGETLSKTRFSTREGFFINLRDQTLVCSFEFTVGYIIASHFADKIVLTTINTIEYNRIGDGTIAEVNWCDPNQIFRQRFADYHWKSWRWVIMSEER